MPLRVTSPYDGAEICELPFDEGDAIERKAAFAYAAQDVWSRVPLDERISRVRAAMGHFRDNGESIAEDVTRQMGKPITQSRGEVATLLDRADHMLSIAPDALATDVLDRPGFVRRIEHAPLGVVLDIAAWDYPLIIAVKHWLGTIAREGVRLNSRIFRLYSLSPY